MALTEEEKATMRAATHEAALVLVDDLQFLRDTLTKLDPTTGDVRRLSGTLRRLLLDGHLQAVAAARCGRLSIPIPDKQSFLESAEGDFVSVGIAPMFGGVEGVIGGYRAVLGEGGHSEIQLSPEFFIDMRPAEPEPVRLVTIDTLLSDQIARHHAARVTRADVLKFICYHAFGVHYTGKERPAFEIIRQFRYAISFTRNEDGLLHIEHAGFGAARKPKVLMDLAHAYAFSTGYYLAFAPDIIELERLIESEDAGG